MRVALRDVEEEDIMPHFRPAAQFIQAALDSGGSVLGAAPGPCPLRFNS